MTTWKAQGGTRSKCDVCGKFRRHKDVYFAGRSYFETVDLCIWCMDSEQRIIVFSRDRQGRKLVEDILQRKRDSVLRSS